MIEFRGAAAYGMAPPPTGPWYVTVKPGVFYDDIKVFRKVYPSKLLPEVMAIVKKLPAVLGEFMFEDQAIAFASQFEENGIPAYRILIQDSLR